MILNASLPMKAQITAPAKSASYQLWQIRQLIPQLSPETQLQMILAMP